MFLLDAPPVVYADPWKSSFGERLAALAKGEQRVAYFYEHPDTSTFRYRVYNMIQVLTGSKQQISAAYFHRLELDHFIKIVDAADILVICRSRYSDKLNRLITCARSRGKEVIFDIDDQVFDPAFVHLVLHTLDQDLEHPQVWDHWFAYVSRIGATMRLCDRVIATNQYLAARIREYSDKPVSVIPNFLNREQMEISQKLFEEKRACGFASNGQIHLGYFSGTPTHNKDFEIVSGALERLLARDPRLVLRIVGFMKLDGSLQKFWPRVESYPLHDFVNLQRVIGQVEVNLVPLQDNPFTNCKSELKYFEAGVVGTLTVASPIYSYANSIRDGENGYLAKSFEWQEKIEALIDSLDNYPEMAEKAFEDSEKKYAWYRQLEMVQTTLFSMPTEISGNAVLSS